MPLRCPQFIEEDKIVQKCDTCRALREAGHEPVRGACPMRAIEFGGNGRFARRPSRCGERGALHGAGRHDDPQHPHRRQPRALLEDFNPVVLSKRECCWGGRCGRPFARGGAIMTDVVNMRRESIDLKALLLSRTYLYTLFHKAVRRYAGCGCGGMRAVGDHAMWWRTPAMILP